MYQVLLWISDDGKEELINNFVVPVIISIPYALKPGESIGDITAFSISEDESIKNMAGYYKAGFVVLKANRLETFITMNNSKGFIDISEKDWYYKYVSSLAAKGLIMGTGNNMFAPGVNVTRAQFTTFINRAIGLNSKHEDSMFLDVPKDKWYFNPIESCAEAGLVSGFGNGYFGPERPITREDMVVILIRALKYSDFYKPAQFDLKFNDRNNISGYAYNAVKDAVELGVICGKDGNYFDPKGYATRAEAAKVLYVLMELLTYWIN